MEKTILAVVCGLVIYGDETLSEFLGISTSSFAANEEGARDAFLDVAWQCDLVAQDFEERFVGVMVYFYTRDSLAEHRYKTVELKAREARRLLGLYAVNGSDYDPDDDLDDTGLYREPCITWGDLEPFAPDDFEDYLVEPEWD